jgi:hypothetical protein
VRNLVLITILAAGSLTACSATPTQADGKVAITQTVVTPATPQLSPGSLSVSPTGTGIVSTTVHNFQYGNAASGGVPPYTFAWTFGDGEAATGPTTAHVYKSTGDFTVTATVTDSKGSTGATSVGVSVRSVTGVWSARISSGDVDTINLIQNDVAVSATLNSRLGLGLGTGNGSLANPRSLTVAITFANPPTAQPPDVTPPAVGITYSGTLNDSLLTWTGTVSGYDGCPCSFTATRSSANATAAAAALRH